MMNRTAAGLSEFSELLNRCINDREVAAGLRMVMAIQRAPAALLNAREA